ncbi:uncharacterized protein LOC125680701 [Ostrea edulis]|uniref:uncharacterized protein LOC125680701 n=1 Tax=Ostrea edulis TaxID=37623 RepID=UPI0024AEE71C|nr:uncharacterized protein LOC125680701 [Ostrea edulis]
MCVILLRFSLILTVCLVIGVYTAPRAPRRLSHPQPARFMHAEPSPNIPRTVENIPGTDEINILKKPINNTKDTLDMIKRTRAVLSFCKFCLQPIYKDSTDCQKHCTNFEGEQGKIITTKELAINDRLSKGKGNKSKSKVFTDALCAFCKLYQVYQQTSICQQKLCSSAS